MIGIKKYCFTDANSITGTTDKVITLPVITLPFQVLHALVSNTTIIKEVLVKGSLIYLLHLFCNSSSPNIREDTALLFSKVRHVISYV